MATSDGYGQRLGERLRVEEAPAIVTKTLRKAEIAYTEKRLCRRFIALFCEEHRTVGRYALP